MDVLLQTGRHLALLEPVLGGSLVIRESGRTGPIGVSVQRGRPARFAGGPALEVIEGDVGGDAEDPGGARLGCLERGEATVDPGEHLLGHVLGMVWVPDEPGHVPCQPRPVLPDDRLELMGCHGPSTS